MLHAGLMPGCSRLGRQTVGVIILIDPFLFSPETPFTLKYVCQSKMFQRIELRLPVRRTAAAFISNLSGKA
jgi:hypothetical protein